MNATRVPVTGGQNTVVVPIVVDTEYTVEIGPETVVSLTVKDTCLGNTT